jgi:hypothetical protein
VTSKGSELGDKCGNSRGTEYLVSHKNYMSTSLVLFIVWEQCTRGICTQEALFLLDMAGVGPQ